MNIVYILILLPTSCFALQMFTYDGVSSQNGTKVMVLKSDLRNLPDNFTVCTVLYIDTIRDSISYIEFWEKKESLIHFWFYMRGDKTGLRLVMGFSVKYPETLGFYPMEPFKWHKICVNMNYPAGMIAMAINGEIVSKNHFSSALKSVSHNGSIIEKIILGDSNHQFKTSIGFLNIYSEVISVEKISQMSTNCCSDRGDILDWETSEWVGGLKVKNVSEKEFETEIVFDLDLHQNFNEATTTCKKLRGGSLYFPDVRSDVQSIEKYFLTKRSNCSAVWTNYSVESESNLPYAPGQPNSKYEEVCVWSSYAKMPTPIMDGTCDMEICFICKYLARPLLFLKGMCDRNKKISKFYTPVMEKGDLYFLGLTGENRIEYDEVNSAWNIRNIELGETLAMARADKNSFALGKQQWTIYNDTVCNNSPEYDIQLSLDSCNTDEFNCDDGSCIHVMKRCDLKEDCEDKSDEKGCDNRVIKKSMYNKFVSPNASNTKAKVNLTVYVTNIININEESGYFWISGMIETRWFDDRLVFKNLKKDESLNALSNESINDMWMAWIALDNALSESMVFGETIVTIRVREDSQSDLSELSSVKNELQFSGKHNSIIKRIDFNAKFLCNYFFTWKPFDFQHCFIDLVLAGDKDKYVKLEATAALFTGSKYFQEYFILTPSICEKKIGLKNGVRVEFLMRRRIPNILANIQTTFVPTILVNIIGQATFYMMPRYFNTAVTVNLTAMLLLTTM